MQRLRTPYDCYQLPAVKPMPKVSVIIPAYNAMTFLPETLASVLNQTFTDFEVIIVNDGSTDSIVEWLTQLTEPRIKLISQENQGLSKTRNAGIAQAQGEYIAFIDADDLWQPTKLEKQVQCLDSKSDAGLVYTWTAYIDENGKSIYQPLMSNAEGWVLEKVIENDPMTNGSSAMVRRSCLDLVGGFDPEMGSASDRDMWIRLAVHYPFALIKEPLTLYRRHTNNMTRNYQKTIQELTKVFEKTFQAFPELEYLRNCSYGWLNLYEGWNFIEQNNWKAAQNCRERALSYYPDLHSFNYYKRLTSAIMLVRWISPLRQISPGGFERFRNIYRVLRRKMPDVFS